MGCRCFLTGRVDGLENVSAAGKTEAAQGLTNASNSGTMSVQKIFIDPQQFGRKIGKHAYDFDLDPSKSEDRAEMKQIINNIVDNADEVRHGKFGTYKDVEFYIKGNDVVLVNTENHEFISILKDGLIHNERVIEAKRIR